MIDPKFVTVVVIEQSKTKAELIELIVGLVLKECNLSFKVLKSSGGKEGMGLLFAANPDFIIIDMEAPEFEENSVFNFILSNDKLAKKKIIIISKEKDLLVSRPQNVFNVNADDPQIALRIATYISQSFSHNFRKANDYVINLSNNLLLKEKISFVDSTVVSILRSFFLRNLIPKSDEPIKLEYALNRRMLNFALAGVLAVLLFIIILYFFMILGASAGLQSVTSSPIVERLSFALETIFIIEEFELTILWPFAIVVLSIFFLRAVFDVTPLSVFRNLVGRTQSRLVGLTIDSESGDTIPFARVRVLDIENKRVFYLMSNAIGELFLPSIVKRADLKLSIYAHGYSNAELVFSIRDDEYSLQSIRLKKFPKGNFLQPESKVALIRSANLLMGILTVVGINVTFYSSWRFPSLVTIIFLYIYAVLFVLSVMTHVMVFKPRSIVKITDKTSKQPLQKALLLFYNLEGNLIQAAITNSNGEVDLHTPPDMYRVVVYKKGFIVEDSEEKSIFTITVKSNQKQFELSMTKKQQLPFLVKGNNLVITDQKQIDAFTKEQDYGQLGDLKTVELS